MAHMQFISPFSILHIVFVPFCQGSNIDSKALLYRRPAQFSCCAIASLTKNGHTTPNVVGSLTQGGDNPCHLDALRMALVALIARHSKIITRIFCSERPCNFCSLVLPLWVIDSL